MIFNMSKIKILILIVVVVASVAASVVIRHRGQVQLQEREKSIQAQADALMRMSGENERFTKLIAQVKSTEPLSREQLTELLKLRSEAGQLRQSGATKIPLQKDNERLRDKVSRTAQQLAEAQALPNYWAKDQLTYAGYGDPESALKSMLAAMNKGDTSAWRTMLTPEALENLQKDLGKRGLSESQQDAEIQEMGKMVTASASGFHILDETMPTADKAIINLSFDGEGAARKFVLKKVGNEWKFQDLLVAGQEGQ
jgi:hypothetical protein